jgi:Flp pilus assembly protein TadD
VIPRPDHRHETARDRARVAAELVEEARLLTETALLAGTADAPPPNGNGHRNGNGHGNGHGNGNGKTVHIAPSRSDTDRALASLDEAVAARPGDVALRLERATQLGAMGRFAAARTDLEYALTLDPDNLTLRSALGIVLLRKGLWGDAVPHLRTVVEAESWSPTAWFYLGEALNHVDDLDGALAAFSRAAELDPRHAKALYGQGVVLDRLRRPDDAARMYRRSREVAGR